MSSVDGLVSGLDTTSIIRQLMQIERLPQALLGQKRTKDEGVSASLSAVRSSVLAVRDLARQLRTPLTWQSLTATSSSDAVSVVAGTGRTTGSLQVTVAQTATAAATFSDTVASLDTIISPTGTVFSHTPVGILGFDAIKGNGIPVRDLPITVTTSTGAATVAAASPPPALPVTLTSAGNTIDLTVDGVARTLALAEGEYATTAELHEAVADAVADDAQLAGKVNVGVDGLGRLQLSSAREGSAATLSVTGGTALSALGLQVAAATGTDGVVTVDGIATTITDTATATAYSLDAGVGTLDVTMGGPLRTGSATAGRRSFGDGSLQDVVDTINSASGLGYTAAAVNTGGGYRLQLTAKQTGAASTVDLDTTMFDVGFSVLSTGKDAKLTVRGDSTYDVTSSTNTFRDLMPGVDVVVNRVSTDPITVTVGRDLQATADKVASLVDALNGALQKIAGETAFDPASGRGSALTGNSAVRRAVQDLTRALVDPVAGGAFASAGQLGIELGRDGTLSFDRAAFVEKVAADPAGVSAMFSTLSGGTTPGIFDRLATAADTAAGLGRGYLTTARDAVAERIAGYTRQIEAYENRMVRREAQLRRTYANLEVALSGLSSQQSWLTGQLNGLVGQSQ